MRYGYARVSTKEQNLGRQIKQLKEDGIPEENIFKEKISGATTEREKLKELLEVIGYGDEIIVVDLTRISRSTQDLFKLVANIKEKGATLKSLKDTWLDTSSDNPYSEFLLTIMAGVNQLERDLIKMRQREGIEIAKENGKYEGRPKKYTEKHKALYIGSLPKRNKKESSRVDKNCNYCIKKTEVYPLASWNNKEVIRYYCINCLPMVKKVEEKERQQFIMYYSDPTRYSWLPEKSKELYKEILDQ